MAVTFDGENKYIILSSDINYQLLDIYNLARQWEDDESTMEHHYPFDCSDELLFKLRYGWKFKPSGYGPYVTIKISGKITTTEGDAEVKTVPPTVGDPVTWQFDSPATAVIVPVGETVNVWNEPPTPGEIRMEIDDHSEMLGKIDRNIGGLY